MFVEVGDGVELIRSGPAIPLSLCVLLQAVCRSSCSSDTLIRHVDSSE